MLIKIKFRKQNRDSEQKLKKIMEQGETTKIWKRRREENRSREPPRRWRSRERWRLETETETDTHENCTLKPYLNPYKPFKMSVLPQIIFPICKTFYGKLG